MTIGVLEPYRQCKIGKKEIIHSSYSFLFFILNHLAQLTVVNASSYYFLISFFFPFVSYFLASKLLERMEEKIIKAAPKVTEMYLHVQTTNEVAVKFYLKHGYTIQSTITSYYTAIDNPDAHLISKPVVRG